MLFMPFNFLIIWLVGLLTIGVLGGGIYILYEWYERELVGISYLIGDNAMVVFAGRFISLPLLRRKGADDPKLMRTGTVQRVRRPDGSVFQVEFYGPADGQPIMLQVLSAHICSSYPKSHG